MSPPAALVYFIDGHGFGHATRSLAILRELRKQCPALPIVVRTSAPAFLFRELHLPVLAGEVGPGMLQADPLTLDVPGSVAAAVRFHDALPQRVAEEIARLSEYRVGLIAGDIPTLAFEVAHRLRVPSVALGNFSWDWIYEPLVECSGDGARLLRIMRRAFGRADLLLRMPLHGDMACFTRVEDIPHVVRSSRRERSDTRRLLGLEGERRPVVLVSFGGSGPVRFSPAQRPPAPGNYRFVQPGPLVAGLPEDTVRLPVDHEIGHADLVAACDAVLSKPGYGTVVECLASRTPLLYTSRDDFREYPILVDGLRRGARCRFLPREDLLTLQWREHLEVLLSDDRPWPSVRTDGARVAATRLLELLAAR